MAESNCRPHACQAGISLLFISSHFIRLPVIKLLWDLRDVYKINKLYLYEPFVATMLQPEKK